MKEIELLGKDALQVKEVAPVKSRKKFLGSVVPKRGHTCFEYNFKTKELVEATFTQTDAFYPLEGQDKADGRKIIVRKEGCAYVTALNKKNALKKIARALANNKI
jgi:hypothetical protein